MKLRDANHYLEQRKRAYELYERPKYRRAGIRHLLSVLEHLQIIIGTDGNWWVANCYEGKKVYLCSISSPEEAKQVTKKLTERRSSLKEEQSSNDNEDFLGEYTSEAPVARSKIFRTAHIPMPIDRLAEGTLRDWF